MKNHASAKQNILCEETLLGVFTDLLYTVEFQWLEQRRLVYHGSSELFLESLGKNLIATDLR